MSFTMDLYTPQYNEAQKSASSLNSYNNIITNWFETIDEQVVTINCAQCIVSYNASQQTYVLHIPRSTKVLWGFNSTTKKHIESGINMSLKETSMPIPNSNTSWDLVVKLHVAPLMHNAH
jgi:hypothetical protein